MLLIQLTNLRFVAVFVDERRTIDLPISRRKSIEMALEGCLVGLKRAPRVDLRLQTVW